VNNSIKMMHNIKIQDLSLLSRNLFELKVCKFYSIRPTVALPVRPERSASSRL